MSTLIRKLLLLLGGLLIAAGITYYPWTYLDRLTGAASSAYGMSAILWAPTALILGVVSGATFAFVFWPRKPSNPGPTKPDENGRERSSFEA